MRIWLTGSSGFIGKNLKKQLGEEYKILTTESRELNLSNLIVVQQFLKDSKPDVVIHAANVNTSRNKIYNSYDSLEGNLRMFFNLERCRDYYGKMYYFGSGAEYDMQHYVPNMKEEYFGTYIPKDPYGFSKYIMSKTCNESNNIYDLRLFGVYGKYEEYERRFISNAICRALAGKDITIQKNVYFDYLYVQDLADIMKWFIENEPMHKHYNVCRGTKIDLYSLAVMVRKILNIDCNILVAEEGWKPEYTGDNSRLISEMGEYEFTGFEQSIKELCSWYREHWSEIDGGII